MTNDQGQMTKERIQSAIPHRPPMLLVDEVISRDEKRIVARKTFRADEFFFQGHYPNQPIVPGVILCESAMQAGAILLSQHMPADGKGVPVATRMNDVKFRLKSLSLTTNEGAHLLLTVHTILPRDAVQEDMVLRDVHRAGGLAHVFEVVLRDGVLVGREAVHA